MNELLTTNDSYDNFYNKDDIGKVCININYIDDDDDDGGGWWCFLFCPRACNPTHSQNL